MTVRFGLGLFTGQVPAASGRTFAQEYAETIELSRRAEAAGFDSVWVSEHHGATDGYLPSLLPMLAAIAAATERVRLGTGVLLVPFHDPLRLAEDAAVVDQISNGRLSLGLGLGWREEEFRMWGLPVGERLRRTIDTIEVLRRAWSGERFSFEGRHFSYDRVLVTPPPAQAGGPPIYLGGHAEKPVRRAGLLADGYIQSRAGLEIRRAAVTWAEEGARDAGRDPSTLKIALLQNAFVAEDPEAAWAAVRDGVAHQLGTYRGWAQGGDTPDGEMHVLPPDEETMRETTPVGTPEQVVEQLRPLVELGTGHELDLIVRLQYPGMDLDTATTAIELFATRVMPALTGGDTAGSTR